MMPANISEVWRIVIPGPPRTKKNHGRIIRAGGRVRMIPSAPFEEWNKTAQIYLRMARIQTITQPVNCCAMFYREKSIGDAVGFFQALADALEEAGIVENDRLIVSWDGSRMRKDAKNPRIEVTLTLLVE